MNLSKRLKATATLLILHVILVTVPFFILQAVFEFPDILRKPAADVLPLFHKNEATIVFAYYFFMLSGLLLIPIAIALHTTLKETVKSSSLLLSITAAFGVSAGITQIIGFIRWPFLVPYLADAYLAPSSSTATKEASVIVYEAFNRFAGMAIGEHLGFVFLGFWVLGFSLLQLKSIIFKSWVGWIGMIAGVGITVSGYEQISGGLASTLAALNITANYIFITWLLISAVFMIRNKAANLSIESEAR